MELTAAVALNRFSKQQAAVVLLLEPQRRQVCEAELILAQCAMCVSDTTGPHSGLGSLNLGSLNYSDQRTSQAPLACFPTARNLGPTPSHEKPETTRDATTAACALLLMCLTTLIGLLLHTTFHKAAHVHKT